MPSSVQIAQASPARSQGGSQTLLRGLDVIESVVDGPVSLDNLAARLGYQLGPKLLELGFHAQRQTDMLQRAQPHLEALAAVSEDTVHLGVLDHERALYLAKIPGRRRVEISSRVGERHPLTSTGLGKALLVDGGAFVNLQ